MHTTDIQCVLYEGVIDYITRMIRGDGARHSIPDWSDWYDSWYAALNVCEATASQLGTEEAVPGHPLYVSSQALIHHLQYFTSTQYKDQKSSVGWSDGIRDCVKLIQDMKREAGEDVISIRQLQAKLDKLRRYPRENRLR